MDAPGRSCRGETAADFQPTDENLNLHHPPVALPHFTSPTPQYRPDTKPEPAAFSVTESPEARGTRKDSPAAFSAAPARPTPPRERKGHYKQKKQETAEVNKKAKASTQITEVQWASGWKASEAEFWLLTPLKNLPLTRVTSAEGRTPAMNASLEIQLRHTCSYTLVTLPTSTSRVRTKDVVACRGMTVLTSTKLSPLT